jgi:hypothetical protein
MKAAGMRPGSDDTIVGIDLVGREYQAVIDASGHRLTRLRVAFGLGD